MGLFLLINAAGEARLIVLDWSEAAKRRRASVLGRFSAVLQRSDRCQHCGVWAVQPPLVSLAGVEPADGKVERASIPAGSDTTCRRLVARDTKANHPVSAWRGRSAAFSCSKTASQHRAGCIAV